ncbi:Glycosyl transferase, group 2 family protein [Sulfitobacter noctilucicola]|uniref:GT2 family glycosyltransferase n=1 Tax=Sulfitobacter noctilucicola TaxID=1342301 RepID=A0A7W6M9X2_9RHOB|nr:glycosyltransferase [Sulfitobacter noctilucicola]KIN64463.1 Glycosyl transferase, group 2 family protein [Sulfitobacter noctilucicola]MBB4174377.1 GT2 family glycosyltransferase [Sulfitobacter noctilucicola]
MSIAAVVIGRNEGDRLMECLAALKGKVAQIIYVDSGSTDGSVAAARNAGAEVVELDMAQPFTAARARNAGLAELDAETEYVQLLDGDCVLREGWIEAAHAFLHDNAKVAVVCGRRRERAPSASIYNALIDAEWDTPIGQTKACGGDALMRVTALREVGGYRDDLIAGEEPEMCVRLRQRGWQVWRLDAEMTWHDAAITRFAQWWRRSVRAGHAFAEGAALHGSAPERHWVVETRRALLWGAVMPLGILLLAFLFGPWAFALFLVYPLQVWRLTRRVGLAWAFFTTIAKFAESYGALKFYITRLRGGSTRIIEYK